MVGWLGVTMDRDTPRTDEEIKRISSQFDGDEDDIQYAMDQLGIHSRKLERELAAMQKQRDKTIRLLGVMVKHIRDDMPSGPPVPEHYCYEIHRPDIGVCKFCDSWQDANILLYGDEWGSD